MSGAMLFVGVLSFVAGAWAGPTAAAKRSKKKDPVLPAADAAAITEGLKSRDPDEVQAALDRAKEAGKLAAPLAPAIAELLRQGTSAPLAQAAMQELGALQAPDASAFIRPYTRHRLPDLRQTAVKALLRTGGPDAVAGLRDALSDADPVVRGLAATGLGTLKAKEAMHDLFVALDHHVDEAAGSIGQLCSPEECEQFAGKMGAVPFDVMVSGFDPILFRPLVEISEDEKIKIVGRLRELGTNEAGKYLSDVQSRWPSAGPPRLKQALAQAVIATGGGAAAPAVGTPAPEGATR